MSKKGKVEEGRKWEGLHPEILALIFSKIPPTETVTFLPLVCKSWMEVVSGPYGLQNIDIQAWCRRHKDNRDVDQMVKKLIVRSICTVQRLSAYRMGELGFFFVANGGRCLKVLEIPMSHTINDHMVMMHMKAMPNLRVLDISHCSKITAKGLEVIGKQCKSLVHLKRYLHPPKDILTKCKSLKHLDVLGCWNVKLNGDLKEMCEKLECFRIHQPNYPRVYRLRLWRGYWRRSMDDDKDLLVELEASKKRVLEELYL